MRYPTLPMAVVTFLAGVSRERAELPRDRRNVTVFAHHDRTVRALRFSLSGADDAGGWNEVVQGAVRLFGEGDTHTMGIAYPADGTDPVDFGVLMEGGRKPSFFQWGYDPAFDIRLAPQAVIEQISRGEGVSTIQTLLDRDARGRIGSTPLALANPSARIAGSD